MAVSVPFPLPATGYALNSKVRVNLDFIVDVFNEFNSGTATWDAVYIGTANSSTGPLVLYNSSNVYSLTIQAGATDSNTTYTLPTSVAADTTSKYLTCATDGVLSWDYIDVVPRIGGTANQVTVGDDGDGTVTLSTPQNIHTSANAEFASLTVANSLAGPTPSLRFSGDTTSGFYFTQANPLSDSQINLTVNGGNTARFYKDHIEFSQQLQINEGTNPGLTVFASGSDATDSKAYIKLWTYDGEGAGPGDCWTWASDGFNELSWGYDNGVGFSVSGSSSLGTNVHFTSTTAGIQLPAGNSLTIDGTTSGTVTIDAPATITSYSFTLPSNDGDANQVLVTDGSGNTSWDDVTSAAGAASTALDNLASVAINTSLISDEDQADDIGSSSILWNTVHAKTFRAGKDGDYGEFVSHAPTASKGTLTIVAADCSANGIGATISNGALTDNRTYTLPEVGGDYEFVMTGGTQTVAGEKTFSTFPITPSAAPDANYEVANKKYVDDNTGGATTALDNLASVNINTSLLTASNSYNLGSAGTSWGMLYVERATIGYGPVAGEIRLYPILNSKGYTSFTASSNTGDTVTTVNTAEQAAAREYTIPDAGGNASFVMTAGAQTIGGDKTFSDDVKIAATKKLYLDGGSNTYLLQSSSDVVDIYCGAERVCAFTLGGGMYMQNSNVIYTTAGTAGAPGYSFNAAGRTDDGMYSAGEGSLGFSTGGNNRLTIDSTGAITQPNQPSFCAYNSSNDENTTGDSTIYTVEFDTEIYDLNSDFNNTTDTFTAPVTGKYQLNTTVRLRNLDTSTAEYIMLHLTTSNRIYHYYKRNSSTFPEEYLSCTVTVLADMDASDTAYVTLQCGGGNKVIHVDGNATIPITYFSGSLIN